MTRYEFFKETNSKDLAVVSIKGKFGLYDRINRKEIIPPKYDAIKVLFPDCFAVRVGKYWGAIDRSGKTIAHTIFDEVSCFGENYIRITHSKQKSLSGIMSKDGSYCSRIDYNDFKILENGYIAVCADNNWGVLNAKLVECLPIAYDYIKPYYDNLFFTNLGHWGLCIKNDKNETIKTFSNSSIAKILTNYCIIKQNSSYCILDKSLEKVFDTSWIDIVIVSDDIVIVYDGYYTKILDLKSKSEIFFTEYHINSISDDLFAISSDDRIIALYSRSEGLIKVSDIITKFEPLGDYLKGFDKDGNLGLFDRKGNILIAPKYSLIYIEEDFIIAQLNGKYGIYDKDYKLVSEFIYDQIYEIHKTEFGNCYRAHVSYNGEDGIFYF